VRPARVIHAVESHACGEPGRVIVGGVLDVLSLYSALRYFRTRVAPQKISSLVSFPFPIQRIQFTPRKEG